MVSTNISSKNNFLNGSKPITKQNSFSQFTSKDFKEDFISLQGETLQKLIRNSVEIAIQDLIDKGLIEHKTHAHLNAGGNTAGHSSEMATPMESIVTARDLMVQMTGQQFDSKFLREEPLTSQQVEYSVS